MKKNPLIKNPLIKRIPRELLGEWRKYLVVSLFLILTIGFVSGMYVANESMIEAADEGMSEYKLESGHFELKEKADKELLFGISSGDKADIRQYYIEEAQKDLDKEFKGKFEEAFTKKFTSEFESNFEAEFETQVKESLMSQWLDEASAQAALPGAPEQAKQTDDYQAAYDKAYDEAYQEAYDEAYPKAYDEARKDMQEEIDEKYEEAEAEYELNDPEFKPVPADIYENFYRNEEEDKDNDGRPDGTVRVYAKTENVNLACLMEGDFPVKEDEIAIDRMHADNAGIKAGDTITVGGVSFKVTGLIAYVNYATLHEKNTDFIFDAIQFDVAMVTESGFEQLHKSIHYAYAWRYAAEPADVKEDEKEEKKLSDDFLKVLLTQTVVHDNEIEDYIPRYANQAVHFATDDMGSDKAMGGVLLDILIVIIAFIFAITISNTIARESQTIGTLRASGYTKAELVRHYLSMPVIVTLFAAGIGNLLGYTIFKNVVVSMYYNSYSLPAYETIWNPDAFVKTTLVPVVLMFVVNLAVIMKMMRHTPLEFLRQDLKKQKRKKAVRLPEWRFFARFRLRIMLQNIPDYAVLFFGILFIMVMLAMAVGMPDTLAFYKENAEDLMFAKYQYVLKSYKDEDGTVIHTENENAEKFSMQSLLKKSDNLDEEVSVYGISDGSKYVKADGLDSLSENEVYISESFRDKFKLEIGDTVSLEEKYENKQYQFQISGFYDRCQSIAVFMPVHNYSAVFDLEEQEFGGYMSDSEITDIEKENIATVITKRDITKMCDQLDHSMGAYMQYFQLLCILLSAVLIYLLTKIMIEKNENAISMAKILGYGNREIAGLYLLSTTIVLIFADAASVFLGALVMARAWEAIMGGYSGWFTFVIEPAGYVKMFLFVLAGYLLVLFFDFKRIKRIPLEAALKNVE